MSHNLQYQLKSAIDANFREGIDKRAYKGSHGRQATEKVFSYSSRKDLIQTSANFAKYIKQEYPEVKLASQIRSEHAEKYLLSKKEHCTSATVEQYAARLSKINLIVNDYFKSANASWNAKAPEIPTVKMRDISFQRDHYDKVMERVSNCDSYRILDLAGRFGGRVDELTYLRAKDINFNSMELRLVGKGGRERLLPIRERDVEPLKRYLEGKTSDERLFDVKKGSVNSYLGRHCKRLGITVYKNCKTGVHAIRKMLAQELYDEKRLEGYTREEALAYVNNYLGHGDHRPDISDTYVQNQW